MWSKNIFQDVHEKNDFAEIFKNLVR